MIDETTYFPKLLDSSHCVMLWLYYFVIIQLLMKYTVFYNQASDFLLFKLITETFTHPSNKYFN